MSVQAHIFVSWYNIRRKLDGGDIVKARRRTLVLLSSLLVLLLSVLFFFYIRADIWFYIEDTLRLYPAPSIEKTNVTEGEEWTLEELEKKENVTVSTALMLVNSTHPLPDGYEAEITDYNGAKMHPLMVQPYISLRDRVEKDTRVRIYVSSDFRTREEQEEIIAESEEGTAAPLGCSEHEAGLALDVYAPYFAGGEFLRSPAGRAVNRLCSQHGFIIRYPRGKEDITGIAYEPWHLRYVGIPHAEIMTEAGLVLEEYLALLTPEQWFAHGDCLILRTSQTDVLLPSGWKSCELSPDNTGYTVITLKMS
ncbi:MAG: D-alanyl-D-alanine carboxypeptidase family protein [Ruminococcaceae bacterium]|nr:D-alanyl-D-alanine carboxypeptidase family protein [Oscillospiraceae bacterium]